MQSCWVLGYIHKYVLCLGQIPVVTVTLVLALLVQFSWLAVTKTVYRCSQRSWDKVQLVEVVLQVRLCPSSPRARTWYASATGEGLHDTRALSSSQEVWAATFVGGHGSRKWALCRMNLLSKVFKILSPMKEKNISAHPCLFCMVDSLNCCTGLTKQIQ